MFRGWENVTQAVKVYGSLLFNFLGGLSNEISIGLFANIRVFNGLLFDYELSQIRFTFLLKIINPCTIVKARSLSLRALTILFYSGKVERKRLSISA